MRRVPSPFQDFARRLLMHEAGGHSGTEDLVAAMERMCDAVHVKLIPLLGVAGVNALLGRAVVLAGREYPVLGNIDAATSPDCSFAGLRTALAPCDDPEAANALVAIFASFVALLVEFIGENLGLRKVQEACPGVPITSAESSR